MENDKLKQQLKKKDEEVVQTRATLERFANAVSKNCIFSNYTISTQQKKPGNIKLGLTLKCQIVFCKCIKTVF